MNDICPLEVTQQEVDDIKQCEAVVIREYEREDGSRIGRPVAWGDVDEMQDQADRFCICVVPFGFSIVCQQMVLVSDLLQDEVKA